MVSKRYITPTLILLLLTLIPTVIHNYYGALHQDGKIANNISSSLDDFIAETTSRKPEWVKEIFNSDDWIERVYHNKDGANVRLFVARSYDHKKLFHHPELALSYAQNLSFEEFQTLPGQPPIEVKILKKANGNGLVGYALLYDNHFARNPITHLLEASVQLLFSPRKAMTLFYVAQDNVSPHQSFTQTDAAKILQQSIISFLKQND